MADMAAGTLVKPRQPQIVNSMQGIAIPNAVVDPKAFMSLTKRHISIEKTFAYTGQTTEPVELKKADILSSIKVRFTGNLNVAGAVVNTTARWPYDLITAKFTANGASSLINCSGLKLKLRDIQKNSDLTDRGVSNSIGGVARTQGTLSRAWESWGVGSQATGVAIGNYGVELEWDIPIAEDEVNLLGAIFLQTSTADLTLTLDLLPIASLFTGAGVPTLTGTFQVITTKYAVPTANGNIIVPDLSMFHSIIQSSTPSIQNGPNEVKLTGQGGGKLLLRAAYQLWNGAGTAAVPVAMTTANFGPQAYRYGNAEQPDEFFDGNHMRADQERRYNCDVGGLWGFGCHDFAHENTFRDALDMGTAAELRFATYVQNALTLASPRFEYFVESVFTAGTGA
jgi:hypothetical protein